MITACQGHRPLFTGRRVGLLFLYGAYHSASGADALNIAVLTGSTRTTGPPAVLGPRVSNCITKDLEGRGHTVDLLDPKELGLELLDKPEFAYARSRVPPLLESIRERLERADAYVSITPEYNHAPSPALVNIFNHFGSSVFSYKPSAIVTYSGGQWGGTRAAMGLRPILSELGCLPVSAMIHIPKAGETLNDDGSWVSEKEDWEGYCGRCWSQLEWWATASRNHRCEVDPFTNSPALTKAPSQRNAPGS